MNCKEQEIEVTNLINSKIKEAIRYLGGKSFDKASREARIINEENFYGNPLIVVKESSDSREGIIEVFENLDNSVKTKSIQNKIDSDNRTQTDSDTQERIAELKRNNDYYQQDMDIFDDILPSTLENLDEKYDEFNYENVVSNKLIFKEIVDRKLELLLNKQKNTENLTQIENFKELSRKIKIDLDILQEEGESLNNYLDSFNRDLVNVKELLKYPTAENIDIIGTYIKDLKLIFTDDVQGLLRESTDEIENSIKKLKNTDPTSKKLKSLLEIKEKLNNSRKELSLLEDSFDIKNTNLTKDLILHHVKNMEESSDWTEDQIKKEAERFYENQIKGLDKGDQITIRFKDLDGQEEKNIIVSTAYKILTDALATNNEQKTREKLLDIKDKVVRELKNLKKTKGKGFNKKVDWSVFERKSDTSYQLIGKFSEQWENFKKVKDFERRKISSFLYKKKDIIQQRQIEKNFKELKDNVDFIDVTRIPEILNDPELKIYSKSFMSESEANSYKSELIAKIGEREYNKIVQEQKENIYSYETFKRTRESRVRDKYNLSEGQDLQANIPEKAWNSHLHFLFSKSPFIFSENFRNKGSNIITKPFYVSGKKHLSENTPADLEFISYTPKKSEHFDSNFSEIENNSILNEAWGYMADLVDYNNKNGFNRNPNNLSEYSLASQEKKIKSFPKKLLGLFSKRGLKSLHEAVTTDQYKDPSKEYNVAGQSTNVDQNIKAYYDAKVKGLQDPSEKDKEVLLKEAKEIFVAKQNEDLIDNILITTESVEKFKAKREVETKLLFLQKWYEKNAKSPEFNKLLKYFVDKQLYQINNRANLNELGWGLGKEASFSNGKLDWTKYYNENEAELRGVIKDSLKKNKKYLSMITDKDEKAKTIREISSMEAFLDSGGKVITAGSLVEAAFIKATRFTAFSINVKAQATNIMIGDINAMEVDGREGFWLAGVYHDAKSFSRKWKSVLGDEETKRNIKIGELLLKRYNIFQNSANEIFKIDKSRAASSLASIWENPMNFVSEAEQLIQRPQIFALMSEIMIEGKDKDGNPIEVPMFDPVSRSFPAFSFDKNNNLIMDENFAAKDNVDTFIDNKTQRYANIFGDSGKIPKAIAYINGNYRNTATYMYQREIVPSLAMLFKQWLVNTVKKKIEVIDRLGENDHAGLGKTTLYTKALVYGFASSQFLGTAFLGPIPMAAALAMYMNAKGIKKVRRESLEDVNWIKAAGIHLKNAKMVPTISGFKRTTRMALAASAQSISMIIDPFTKRQVINSDHIKRIIGLKDKKEDGTAFTVKELRQVKEDVYFLTTSIASTLKFLAFRYAVMLALYPGEDEEEKHKERVKKGDKFWSRLYADPDTATYYMLENMLSSFIDDSNLLVNADGAVRMADVHGYAKLKTLSSDLFAAAEGKATLQGGRNEGDNRFLTHSLKFYTPAMLKDGVSFGFGSSSQYDYDTKNTIDQIKRPEIEKINEARLISYKEEKQRLMESKKLSKMTEKARKKYVNSLLAKKYPVIKDFHMDKNGKIKKVYKPIYKHYWED